jgi:TRAP-type mannitol/chloroaromatic compound transport system substrate-binding protein
MTMKRLKSLAYATALAAGVLAVSVHGPAEAQVQWTMTTAWPSAIELIEIDRKFVETVRAIAGDEINITFHDGGTLVPTFEIFDAVGTGDIQAAGDWPGYWAGRGAAFSPIASHVSLFNALDSILWIQEWGGFELLNEIYGEHNMVYLPYGVTNNESGFRTRTPLVSLEDLEGMRLRLSGREQGLVLERIGGEQVLLAGGEIYTALERGVIDGAEFSVPGVDYEAGFHEVTDHWTVPGWHQSQSLFGVMINKDSWDALDEGLQDKLKIAAERTLLWSLGWSERRSNEGTKAFEEAGVEIHRWSDEALDRVQEMALEVIVQSACEDPMTARVYHSQISYLQDYALWRGMSEPFNLGRNPPTPDLAAIEECM